MVKMMIMCMCIGCSLGCTFPVTAAESPIRTRAYEGIIEPKEIIDISAQVAGILDSILVERGDMVEKGQELARLKSETEKIAVDLARARLDFSERKIERNEELYRKELISQSERDEMETEVQISQLQLRESLEQLEMRTVRSPFRGVITTRNFAPGEYVGTDPVLTMARIDTLNVEVIVPVADFGLIRKGMSAEIQPEAPVEGIYTAKVTIVDQVIDGASGTFGVRLDLPNPSCRLPAGLKCTVRFLSKQERTQR